MSNMGRRTPTETLIHRLRLMVDSGGMLSRDRLKTILEAADRLSEMEESHLAICATCRELAHENNQFRKQLGIELPFPEPEVTQDEEH